MQTQSSFHAHGKLLLTAEYIVLDGAAALALPCRYGQRMEVKQSVSLGRIVACRSLDVDGEEWFAGRFDVEAGTILSTTDEDIAQRFLSIVTYLFSHKSEAFPANTQIEFVHQIDFARDWGLGTSSTLIYNMATWAEVDPYGLAEHTFGGSGYDIACAGAIGPIRYKRNSASPRFVAVDFNPSFKEDIYFVYLGQKQNSREGIKNYRALDNDSKKPHAIAEIEELNDNILHAKTLFEFEESIREHESIIANIIGMPKVQDLHFSDLDGVAKSLGAWGGDFVMLTYQGGHAALKKYCQTKGFEVVIPYQQMIL